MDKSLLISLLQREKDFANSITGVVNYSPFLKGDTGGFYLNSTAISIIISIHNRDCHASAYGGWLAMTAKFSGGTISS
jgi:hypothetical protein